MKLLPPTNPTKIVLVGLNFKDHAEELRMKLPKTPIIFLKPPSSLIAHRDSIIYPEGVKRVDYEAELCFMVKERCKNVSVDEVEEYILGFSCLNDVTARHIQKKEIQWTRAKSFDTFCPVGPWIETEIKDILNLDIKLYLNGELKQNSNTREFIFTPYELFSFISKCMTLFEGDIISCGTPKGIGEMQRGDKVCVDIKGIGRLVNYVK